MAVALFLKGMRTEGGLIVAATMVSFVTLIILKVLDIIPGLGLRVSAAEEDSGLDISMHGERAFASDGAD